MYIHIIIKESQMMNSISSSDFTISNPLFENDDTNTCDNDLLHIYIVVTIFAVSIIGSVIYIFVFT